VFIKEMVQCIQLQSQAHCKHSLTQLWQSFYKTSYTYGDMNEEIFLTLTKRSKYYHRKKNLVLSLIIYLTPDNYVTQLTLTVVIYS
jgi:hypothetical protein